MTTMVSLSSSIDLIPFVFGMPCASPYHSQDGVWTQFRSGDNCSLLNLVYITKSGDGTYWDEIIQAVAAGEGAVLESYSTTRPCQIRLFPLYLRCSWCASLVQPFCMLVHCVFASPHSHVRRYRHSGAGPCRYQWSAVCLPSSALLPSCLRECVARCPREAASGDHGIT